MKYIIIVPDGASDYPLEALGGKTPLEVADIPFMDSLAKKGLLGRVRTVPRGFAPSSDVANLSLFGYDPSIYYTGRGPLEAANLGIELAENDLAFLVEKSAPLPKSIITGKSLSCAHFTISVGSGEVVNPSIL